MRLVLDTNVVASALLWGGIPRRLLQAGHEKHVNLFTSTPMLEELTDILGRRKFEQKIAASGFSVEGLIDRYAELANLVQPTAIPPTILEDPDDDHVLACALVAHADMIVSGDHHLLDLKIFSGIPIVTVAQAILRIESEL